MSTVADLIARRFARAGVRGLFGVPGGGGNLDLLEAAARAGLPFVLSHTETGGALMASAQAEISGAPGVCLATLGPGVASVANGVAHARLDRVPLVVVTDGLPVAARRTYDHQALDHAACLAPLVKRSVLVDPRDDGRAAAAAVAAALEAPPGPVHLDCPSDVASVEADHASGHQPDPMATRATEAGKAIDLPAALFAGSRRPLVIAGLGVQTASGAARLRALCERRGMPALVTYKAKGVVPDTHPSFAGVFTHAAPEEPFVRSADLIVAVGLDPVELLPRPWAYPQRVVACGPWPSDGRHVPVAAQAVGGLDDLVAALDERLPADTAWDPSEIRRHADARRLALRVEAAGFAPYRAVEAAARAAGDARVTVDAGAHMFPIMGLWPVSRPRQLLISNGLSTMGFALPAAIGAALLDRSRRVVALTGDGGLLMCLAELATLARERLRVTVVVFGDRSLSLIRLKQERRGHRTEASALGDIDWPALARSLGVEGSRATNAADLERRVAETMASGGPALVEAAVDASAYAATFKAVRG